MCTPFIFQFSCTDGSQQYGPWLCRNFHFIIDQPPTDDDVQSLLILWKMLVSEPIIFCEWNEIKRARPIQSHYFCFLWRLSGILALFSDLLASLLFQGIWVWYWFRFQFQCPGCYSFRYFLWFLVFSLQEKVPSVWSN